MTQINIEEIKRLTGLIQRCAKDPLLSFVASKEIDDLAQMKTENLKILFNIAKRLKIRYLYVGKGEIAGCENVRDSGGTWPAMWELAKKAGFPGSCGNHDQYQCMGSEIAFPEDSYGGWDLKENKKLSEEATKDMKFHRVVTRR